MTTNAKIAPVIENDEAAFIPLNKLKRHPKNSRKTPPQRGVYQGEGGERTVSALCGLSLTLAGEI